MDTTSKKLNRVKIIVYSRSLVQPPVMDALVRQLTAQRDRIDSEVLTAATAILKSVEETTQTVLIISLHDKEELVEVLNVLTQLASRIKTGLLRTIVLNGMNQTQVMSLLRGKGVTDVVEFTINIKALNLRIKKALLLVNQSFQRLQNQNIQASAMIGGESRAAVANTRPARENTNEVTWLKPTEHPSDFWWIPSARNLRFVMGRWLVDLLGPAPAAGLWESTTYERQEEKGWEWKRRVSTDPTFQPREGRWIFFGRQPEFVWQKNLWSFVSKYPYLAFYAEGASEPEFVRIECPSPGKVSIFENSEIGRQFLPIIQESLEVSMKLSKSQSNDEITGNFERPTEAMGVGGSMNYSQGDLSPDEALPDWNHHQDSVGANIKSKDIRIDVSKSKTKWRNSLSPDSEVGRKLGLQAVQQAGVTAGAKSFDKFQIRVTLRLRNGLEVALKDPIRVIEMTKDHATFEYPRDWIAENDKFVLAVEFHLGSVEKSFEVEWTSKSAFCVDGAGCLAEGDFTGGALTELASIATLIEQRQIELRDFFIVAKGA